MKYMTVILLGATLMSTSCSAASEPKTDAVETSSFHECLKSAMNLTQGEWRYTAVIARLNGAFRVYNTQSIHAKSDEDTWTSRSFGGDVEEDSTSSTRLQGDKWIPIEDGELMTDQAMTFLSCEGPNNLGWYATTSEYQLPPDPVDPEPYYVKVSSTYGEKGSYFAEDIVTAHGTIVARRSGVTIPAN